MGADSEALDLGLPMVTWDLWCTQVGLNGIYVQMWIPFKLKMFQIIDTLNFQESTPHSECGTLLRHSCRLSSCLSA